MSALNFTTTGGAHTHGHEEAFRKFVDGLKWTRIGSGLRVSYGTSAAVVDALRELPGGALTHLAEGVWGGLGIVAIRRSFRRGPVNIYLADEGSQTVVLATEQVAHEPADSMAG